MYLLEEFSLLLFLKEVEGIVEKYFFKEVWLRDDMDVVVVFLSRIVDIVVFMNGELNNLLKVYCS